MAVVRKKDDFKVMKDEKAKLNKFTKGANSDSLETEEEVQLKQVSVRIHPEILKAIEKLQKRDKKKFSEALRDVLMEGLRVKEIEF